MTLAIWDITTITSVAANTHFGVVGRWEEIPDMFPPIGFMFTSTTPGARAQKSNYGLYFEYQASTSVAVAAGGLSAGCLKQVPLRVFSYQKGTRWFIIQAPMYDAIFGSGHAFGELKTQNTNPVKRLVLYYRSMDEYGETPA